MRRVLPKLLAVLTRHPRYLVTPGEDFQWSQKSWTHNIFRGYELLFGRRFGIKAEMSYIQATGVYACHSWEAAFALFETWVRGFYSYKLPVKVWIPVLATPQGTPIFASPYLFAIAWDAAQTNMVTPATTGTFTCTGSNGKLFIGDMDGTAATNGTVSATYNSVAFTKIQENHDGAVLRWISLWYLDAPATGSNTWSVNASGGFSTVLLSSYSGCTTGIDSSAKPSLTASTATSFNIPTTVVAANCWLIATGGNDAAANVAGTGTTQRANDTNNGNMLSDSNATVGTGSQQLNMTSSVAGHWVSCVASFAPVATAAAKSVNSDIVFFN